MKFGIIAEGRGDCAVILNILIGLGLVGNVRNVSFLRPKFASDTTDLTTDSPSSFSSWTLVKSDCIEKSLFKDFFEEENPFQQERKIIIHLDTAECHLPDFGIQRPDKNAENYCESLRLRVIEKITEWLENQFLDDTYFAIAIEEMEAWVHCLFEQKDSSKALNAKQVFKNFLSKHRLKDKTFHRSEQRILSQGEFAKASFYSVDFQKLARKKFRNCLDHNPSLKLFINSLPLANSPEINS